MQLTARKSILIAIAFAMSLLVGIIRPALTHAESATMAPGTTLPTGGKLVSADGHYTVIMQTDSNLVVYSWPRPLWASNTGGKNPYNDTVLEMQRDGNLVLYSHNHVAIWASNTAGNWGAYLVLQNDANLVIVAPDGRPLWASGSTDSRLDPGQKLLPGWRIQSPDRRYWLVMQGDANLVEYDGYTNPVAVWASNTNGKNGSYGDATLEMQTDGNLVIYGHNRVAIWASNTAGRNGAALVGDNSGAFNVIQNGTSYWSTRATNRQVLAQQILNNLRITLAKTHVSGVSDRANAYQNIVDTAEGKMAQRSCYQTAPCGSVWLDATMLQDILNASSGQAIKVSEIAGGSHSSGSLHYSGKAADLIGTTSTANVAGQLWVNRSSWGLNELIHAYMPNGTYTLKNGTKFTYASTTLNQHRSHVHFSVK